MNFGRTLTNSFHTTHNCHESEIKFTCSDELTITFVVMKLNEISVLTVHAFLHLCLVFVERHLPVAVLRYDFFTVRMNGSHLSCNTVKFNTTYAMVYFWARSY